MNQRNFAQAEPCSWSAGQYAAVVLVLVMAAVLLVAGCIGSDSKSDQDIHLIKLNHDGSVAWTKLIDTGKDDEVNDLIQTSDGGYLFAGGYSIPQCNQNTHGPTTATLTRISPDGNILWVHNYNLNGKVMLTNAHENFIAVFQTPDSGFLIVSQFGMIEKLDSDGNIQWNRTISDKRALQLLIYSATGTRDEGYVLGGTAVCCDLTLPKNYTMMITKLDQNANESWINIYHDSNISSVQSLIELENDQGSVGLSLYLHELVLFDKNGTIRSYIPLRTPGTYDPYDPYKIQAVPGGFFVYQENFTRNNLVQEMHFDNKGNPTGNRSLFNISHWDIVGSRSDETLLTKDLGYLTINISRAQLLTANGSVVWDKEIISADVAKNRYNTHVRRIIETDDGGFLVVYGIEKLTLC
jgi:hypothetical protein